MQGNILQALSLPGSQVAIAATLGASQSTISRIKNERLEEVLCFLYAAGFKVVDQEKVCVDQDAYKFMKKVTAMALADSSSFLLDE